MKYYVRPTYPAISGELTSLHEAREAAAALASQLKTEVAIYKNVEICSYDKSTPIGPYNKAGWYEVWNYRGTKQVSHSVFMLCDKQGTKIFLNLSGSLVDLMPPYVGHSYRVIPCKPPDFGRLCQGS